MTGPDVVRLLRLVLRGRRGFVSSAVAEDDQAEVSLVPEVGTAGVELTARAVSGPLGRRWLLCVAGGPLVVAQDVPDELVAGLAVVLEERVDAE